MASHQGYPRRKDPRSSSPLPQTESPSKQAAGVASREALDVAAYVSDMTAQLEAMALSARLDLLAYFLGMARSEADLFVRTNEGPESAAEGDGNAAESDLSDEDQAEFDSSGS